MRLLLFARLFGISVLFALTTIPEATATIIEFDFDSSLQTGPWPRPHFEARAAPIRRA